MPALPPTAQDDEAPARRIFLSTLPARRADRRLALAVVVASAVVFLATAPFAKVQLGQVWAFIPIYQSAFVVNDLITVVLLLGQFSIVRSPGLLVLASGYLFTALMAATHALTFPGLFSATGLLGAGPQTTAWLYMFWHGCFPLFVIGYALLERPVRRSNEPARPPRGRAQVAILASVAAVAIGVAALALLATVGAAALPAIMDKNRYTPAMIFIVSSVWGLSLLALIVLWRRRRPHSVLEVWLMVVMCAWLFDIALAAVLNGGRFDLGFYVGRIYGLFAASFVLLVLLIENGMLYARLAAAHEAERRGRRLVQQRTAELRAVNKDLETFSYSVSHDLRAPLRAVHGYARMLEEECGERLDASAHRLLGVIHQSTRRMEQLIDDLLAFARLGRQPLTVTRVPLDKLVSEVLEELGAAWEGRRVDFDIKSLGTADVDPRLVKQVLANLLGNAIKYTRTKNPAVVEVGQLDPTDAAEGSVYYVKDNGTGFDMRYADKLFGVFQRLHSTKEYEGTGVGLAIVQRIVQRHGGRVWANATPGAGATFYFTLPPASRGDMDEKQLAA